MDQHTRQVIAEVIAGLVGVSLLGALGIVVAAIVVVYCLPRTQLDPTVALPDEGPHDPAWPNYFRRQHEMDFAALSSKVKSYLDRISRLAIVKVFFFVTWPMLLLAWIVDFLLLAAFFAVHFIVRFVGDTLYWLSVGALRLVGRAYAEVRHSEASCPTCFRVMSHPAYKCPSCGELHRDIRPGRRGSFFRSCTCGRRLPTGVLRAAWSLDAACQYCGATVHRGAAVLQDVRVPVFGEPHAGKTRLIFAGFQDIMGKAKAHGVPVSFPDESSKDRAESGLGQLAKNQRTVKTEWQLNPALTCQIGSGMRGALLHAFDAAGERFRGAAGHDDMRYLDDAHTLIFVVDPFAVPGVREVVARRPRNPLIEEHLGAHARSPADAYGEVVSRVQTNGIETRKQRLAVVVSKADVLDKLDVPAPTENGAIKQWLYDNGLHNVTLAAAREFKEVRYFAVASVDGKKPSDNHSAAAPFLWALSTRGFNGLGVVPASRPEVEVPA